MRKDDKSRARIRRSPGAKHRPPSVQSKLELLADLVPKLARAIAPTCEVVLHENTSQPPTILAIGNGHVTGRSVGDLMTRVVVDGKDVTDRTNPLFNYLSKAPDGAQIRVSLIPILDDDKVIAYIAVNFLVQDFATAQQALSVLVRAEHHSEAIEETFLSPRDVVDRTVEEYLHDCGRPAALMDRSSRLQLIRRLSERGAFGMRGAVGQIASKLGVSRTAIYNYLNEISSPSNQGDGAARERDKRLASRQ